MHSTMVLPCRNTNACKRMVAVVMRSGREREGEREGEMDIAEIGN